MQARMYAALLLAVPAVVFAEECDIPETELEVAYLSVWEAANPKEQGLLESAQRAWDQYRDANCELMSERDREDLKADALATCLDFMDREREFELRLISRLVRPD
jgi:uncharacterized protein YecT (DUF1311 family)